MAAVGSSCSGRNRSQFFTIIFLFLFTLNLLSLFSYTVFLRHPTAGDHRLRRNPQSKPWPILPSYHPWTPATGGDSESCEAFFGNGFSETAEVGRRNAGDGWFRCHFSRSLQSSVCEGGWVRMDPERIRMSGGGERIEEVMGRKDYEELPRFRSGAFRVRVGFWNRSKMEGVSAEFVERYLPEGDIKRHTMRELVQSLEFVSSARDFHCSQWIEEPTLLVTRFEYANIFHTYTDWYSSYVSSRVTALPARPNVVFLDGHSSTQLEETWKALFSTVKFAKHFDGPVCFRHAVFVPLGYETAWVKGLADDAIIDCHGSNPDDHKTPRMSEFGEMITASFGLQLTNNKHRRIRTPSARTQHNVLFVRREDYLAHPRHRGKVKARLSNEEELFAAVKRWASGYAKCKVNVVNGRFAHMPMKDQIRAVREASVIVGAHGAGLTHMVAASPETAILEVISSQFRRPHFQFIARWKGLDYHAVYLPKSYAYPFLVVKQLERIMNKMGC